MIPVMQARIYSDADSSDEGSFRVRVPPTMSYETCIMIAMWNENKKVAVVPGVNFSPHKKNYIRMNFATAQHTLQDAVSRIADFHE